MTEYNETSVVTLDTLSHMRLRLNSYIRDTNVGGQFHLIREMVDNAVDEAAMMNGEGAIEVMMFRSIDSGNYQVAVSDNGRGMPISKILDILLVGNTSGKFNQDSYDVATGSNGIGVKVAVASASEFRCISANGDMIGETGRFNHEKLPEVVGITENTDGMKGTIVVWSPDADVLHEIRSFTEDCSLLTDHLELSSLFANYRIRFYLIEELISPKMMLSDTYTFVRFIESRKNYSPVFDSTTFDKSDYVKRFFNVTQPFIMSRNFKYESPAKRRLTLDLELMVLLTRNVVGNRLTFVNNILFTDKSCYQYALLIKFLKGKLGPLIDSPTITSFMMDNYTLPIWVYGDIKYGGAVFVGLAKTAFKDETFRRPYFEAIAATIPDEYIVELYSVLKDHLQAAYDAFSNKHLKVVSNKSLLTQLNFPTKFADCRAKDRSNTELFLMEGDSAKSDKARDPQFQAGYSLRGKPINGILNKANMDTGISKLKANLIFQDIVKILNIESRTTSNLYFDKLFIATDADAHGYHIADLIMSNIYALCPKFLASGRVYLVMPPHYEVTVGKSQVFVRNTSELDAMLANELYFKCLEIRLRSDRFDTVLSKDEFIAFSAMVSTMGDALSAIASAHFIHPVVLEQLALLTNEIDFNNPDMTLLGKALGKGVTYNSSTKVLSVSIGLTDIVIPMIKIRDVIYDKVLPLFRAFQYHRLEILVTTKQTPSFKGKQVSVIQLHQMQTELRSKMAIRPLKGLGSMSPPEVYATCINPDTRRCKQVSTIGEVDMIFKMMGNDSRWRKELVLSGYDGLM